MHEYNTGRKKLFLKEYGRNIQNLVAHVGAIQDKPTRTQYAQAILKLMASLNSNSKNTIEYTQKRWDDLFIISGYALDIDTDYTMPKRDHTIRRPDPVAYCKQPLRFKHYGRHVELLVKKVADIVEPVEQERMVVSIAKLIKNLSNIWNKDNIDTNNLLVAIGAMSEGKLIVDLEKMKSESAFYTSYTNHKEKNKNYKRAKAISSVKAK